MDGKDVGFWVYGHFVYGACVTVANIVILHKFNNYTGWGEVTAIMMILDYFTFYFLENLFPMFPQIYLIFDTTYIQPSTWLSFLLVCGATSVIEMFFNRLAKLDADPVQRLSGSAEEEVPFVSADSPAVEHELALLDRNQESDFRQKQKAMERENDDNEWQT